MTAVRDDVLWKPQQLAEYIGMTVDALALMRYRGTGPEYVRLGSRTIRYRRADVDAWLEANREKQTTGAA